MYLPDTNILSEIRKGQRCNPGVARWYASVLETDLYVSVLVLGEIRKGIELARRNNDHPKADVLEIWLQSVVENFSVRILPITAQVADAWGILNAIRPVSVIDGLLAATAEEHDLTLVTRNVSDVQGLGVKLLNPFST